MGRWLMLFVGIVYLIAALSFLTERKLLWALVAVCWGIGNLALAYLASTNES
jgi:hypothetical protein